MRRFAIRTLTPAVAATTALRLMNSQSGPNPDFQHFRETPAPHPLGAKYKKQVPVGEWDNPMKHAVWTEEEVMGVKENHRPVGGIVDVIAYGAIKVIRQVFDLVSGYKFGRVTVRKLLIRILFLETAAGIPGMVGGTLRHLTSLRIMRRDYGWIHTLLEEAENERMHMLTFKQLYNPGIFFRALVAITQILMWNGFFLAYVISPRFCHRFVGYLEEEAVHTYTYAIELMTSKDPRDSELHEFAKKPAQDIAKRYWKLADNATMLDLMLAVRADEANHRDVNHTLASINTTDINPYINKHADKSEKK